MDMSRVNSGGAEFMRHSAFVESCFRVEPLRNFVSTGSLQSSCKQQALWNLYVTKATSESKMPMELSVLYIIDMCNLLYSILFNIESFPYRKTITTAQ